MVLDRGGRLAFYAVMAGLIVWSMCVFVYCATIAFAVLALTAVVAFRLFRSEPRGDMEGSMTEGTAVMEREPITKRMAAVAIALFLVTAVGLVAATDVYIQMSSHYVHDYRVTIEPGTEEPFLMMCPIPCDLKGVPYEGLLDDLVVLNGSADLEIIDTEHGPALKVDGVGEVELEWTAVWSGDEGRFPNLTMTRELDDDVDVDAWNYTANEESWVYSDSPGTVVELSFSSEYHRKITLTLGDSGEDVFHFSGILDLTGWATVGTEHAQAMS
ncbi:MAG: hypothetical protein MUE55_06280 [Thermoplasmata archaeon]|nr:hypothetical protein [Thermoplasmata archaeon]